LRATIDGEPTGVLDYRTESDGTYVLIGGRDDKGHFGVVFRRQHERPYEDFARFFGGGDDLWYKQKGGFLGYQDLLEGQGKDPGWQDLAERLGGLATRLQSSDSVIGVEVGMPHHAATGLRTVGFARQALEHALAIMPQPFPDAAAQI
jgi:hypothetical protein